MHRSSTREIPAVAEEQNFAVEAMAVVIGIIVTVIIVVVAIAVVASVVSVYSCQLRN